MSLMISAHNPMTGPRHLGHFASTMASWNRYASDYQIVAVIDDLIPAILYPGARARIEERTLAVVQECMAMDLDFGGDHHILLTSMVPEAHETAFFISMSMDFCWAQALYRESFAGLLSTYQRAELGLPRTPTVAEITYPQCHLAALTLGLGAELFQGGEEMRGYMDIMAAASQRYPALTMPKFMGDATFVLGTDGHHMASENALYISAPLSEIEEQIQQIRSINVFENWAGALGSEELRSALSATQKASPDERLKILQGMTSELLTSALRRFRSAAKSDADTIAILEKSSSFARERLQDTGALLKRQEGITGF